MPRRVWHIRDHQHIYLTFDDGPNPEITPWLLDFLSAKQIKATFFCVGSNVVKHPEIFQRILQEGHAIGNHSMRHEKGSITSNSSYVQSVNEAAKIIHSPLFRPPYGRMNMLQERILRKKYRIVMWSWIAYDFDRAISIEQILVSAQGIKAGDILVLHDNDKFSDRTKELLPRLVELLENKGLKFKAISGV